MSAQILLARRRAMMMSNSVPDPRIKLLFHFDGNYTEERGHTFGRSNTYWDGTYADGVFGQCPWNASGGFNFQIHNVFTEKPNKFTFSFWCYNDGTSNTDVIIGLCRPTGSTLWSSLYKTSGLCIYCLPRNRQLRVCPNGDYNSLRQGTATQAAPSNQWTHYAVTYDNGLISWYCDGNRVGQMQIDHENDFVYKGNDFGLHNWNKCDEIMFADDLLIDGETYTVPTKPYK